MAELIYQLIDDKGNEVGEEKIIPFYSDRKLEAYIAKIKAKFPKSRIRTSETPKDH